MVCRCGGTLSKLSLSGSGLGLGLVYFACNKCQVVWGGVDPALIMPPSRPHFSTATARDILDIEVPETKDVDDNIPVINGSVIGYRGWCIQNAQMDEWDDVLWDVVAQMKSEPFLTGTGYGRGHRWHPGINQAVCIDGGSLRLEGHDTPRHDAPHRDCGCGIHALARFGDNGPHYWRGAHVLGAIEAWTDDTAVELPSIQPDDSSKFFVQPPGFRTRYAKVVLLAIDDEWSAAKKKITKRIAADHGADVCSLEHLEDAAKEHGQLISDRMLEWAKPTPEELASDTGMVGFNFMGFSAFVGSYSNGLSVHFGQMAKAVQKGNSAMVKLGASMASTLNGGPDVRDITKRPKGIKQTLGTPGPPGFGKWKRGDRVLDGKSHEWECVKSGKPGSWQMN